MRRGAHHVGDAVGADARVARRARTRPAEALARLSACDLALVEGYKAYPLPKLEIYRAELGKPPLHPRDPHIVGIATDHGHALPAESIARLPVLPLDDPDAIATFVVAHATVWPAPPLTSPRAGRSVNLRVGSGQQQQGPPIGASTSDERICP